MSVPSSISSNSNSSSIQEDVHTSTSTLNRRNETVTKEQRAWVHGMLRKYLAKFVRDYLSKKGQDSIPSPVGSSIDLTDGHGNASSDLHLEGFPSEIQTGSREPRISGTSANKNADPDGAESVTENNLKSVLDLTDLQIVEETALGDDRITYLSRILSLGVTYVVKNHPEHVAQWLAKVPSRHFDERNLARVANVYRREVSFYLNMLQDMRMWLDVNQYKLEDNRKIILSVPVCFYANCRDFEYDFDPGVYGFPNEEFTLILEDLRALGYGKRHFSVSLTAHETLAAVREIVKFHAISWAMAQSQDFHDPDDNSEVNWPEMLKWTDLYDLYLDLIRQGFRHLKKLRRISGKHPSDQEKVELLDALLAMETKLPRTLERLLKPLPQPAVTALVHLDLWTDNLLFREGDHDHDHETDSDGEVEPELDCVIVDWQMVSLGRISHDLGILFVTSIDGDLRRSRSMHFLQFYYDSFEKIAAACKLQIPFTFSDLVEQYKESCLLAVLLAIGRLDLVVSEPSTLQRFFDILEDLRDEEMLI